MIPSDTTPTSPPSLSERAARAESYGKPREVWVEDGHVFVESYDGNVIRMTPEVAIKLGRKISDAGADSLINKVIDREQNFDGEKKS